TDELPALDPKAYEAAARERLNDTWVQPVLQPADAGAAARGGAEGGEDPLQTAAANLREAQGLLANRGMRLAEIERSLEEARGAPPRSARRSRRGNSQRRRRPASSGCWRSAGPRPRPSATAISRTNRPSASATGRTRRCRASCRRCASAPPATSSRSSPPSGA